MKNEYKEIVIAGPTASGKTACAVRVAAALNGEILSADSRQIYRGLDIGSGKDLEEYNYNGAAVPYHLIDIADAEEYYSLYRYCGDFTSALEKVRKNSNVPVICGGTGLYIEAVLKGYRVSDVPEDADLRDTLMKLPLDELTSRLSAFPMLYASTDIKSKKRVVRALEISEYKGDEPGDSAGRSQLENPLVVIVSPPPEVLRERIALRLEQRLGGGMIEEVRGLRERGVPDKRLAMLGMEYGAIMRYLAGETSYECMKEILYGEICRLAKRQRTWFRGMERRGTVCRWLDSADASKVLQWYGVSID